MSISSSEINNIPTNYMIFYDIAEHVSEDIPHLVQQSCDRNPFIFDTWYVATYMKDGEEVYTIGPKRDNGRYYDPTYYFHKEEFDKYLFLVRKV